MEETATEKELIVGQLFLIFILPVALLVSGIVPVSWRMGILCVAMLFMYGVIQHEKISDKALGITKKKWPIAILVYGVFTILGVFFISSLGDHLHIDPEVVWWKMPHLLFLFLPVSLLQEIAYRGFLFYKLKQLTHNWFYIIAINTLLFTFLHIIYPVPVIMLPVAVASGIFFAVLYRYYPNLILISIAHAILNFTAVWHGFFYFHE